MTDKIQKFMEQKTFSVRLLLKILPHPGPGLLGRQTISRLYVIKVEFSLTKMIEYILCILLLSIILLESFQLYKNPLKSIKSLKIYSINNQIDTIKGNQIDFLISLWDNISFPNPTNEVTFNLNDYGLNRYNIKGILKHFQACKDCTTEDSILIATQNDNKEDILILNNAEFKTLSDNPEDNDETWEDLDENMFENESFNVLSMVPVFPTENSNEIILEITKNWVEKSIFSFIFMFYFSMKTTISFMHSFCLNQLSHKSLLLFTYFLFYEYFLVR